MILAFLNVNVCYFTFSQLSKMADAAAARREARRKKILENSQNRFQIISGKSSDEPLKRNGMF